MQQQHQRNKNDVGREKKKNKMENSTHHPDELTFFEFVSNTSSWRIHDGSNVLITTSWTISADWVFTDWCFCCSIHSLTISVILNWIHSPAPLGISPTKLLSMRVYLCCCCCCCVGWALFFDCSWSLVLCYLFFIVRNENAELVQYNWFLQPLFICISLNVWMYWDFMCFPCLCLCLRISSYLFSRSHSTLFCIVFFRFGIVLRKLHAKRADSHII